MSEIVNVNRRDFLKVGMAAGAGLVLGCRLSENEPAYASAPVPQAFTPNAFVNIAPDGKITIFAAKSEMGQGVRTALPMVVAEELEADWSTVRVEQAPAHPKFGNQGTGGSGSVKGTWKPLRQAGAAARMMLVAAAAQTWGVDEKTCRAEKGFVVHESGKKLGYGELAEAASKLAVPRDVQLKDPKDFKIVGTRAGRVDNPQILNGTAVFGLDVKVPGMLVAVVARCPVFGGKVASFDDSKAKAVAGVRHVVQIQSGVAVVADTTWQAMQGRRALEIKWDEGPNAKLSSTEIGEMLRNGVERAGASAQAEGKADEVLAAAAKKLQAVYEVPYLAHATMEPMNTTADVRADSCEIWAPTQFPGWIAGEAADFLKLPPEKIKVNVTLLGGGFGRRAEPDVGMEAVRISKAVGAPVKLVWTREDDMHHDWYRPASRHKLEASFDPEGRLHAWTHRVAAPSIVGQRWPQRIKNGFDDQAVEGAKISYAIPNVRVDYVMTNTAVPTGWWRSVYNSQNAFANECFMDEIAVAAGKDPYEFRRGLLAKSPRLLGVLDLAATKADWGKPLPKGRYRGIACHYSFDSYVAEVAEVSVDAEGGLQVHRIVCAVDCGIVVNPDMVEAQAEGAIVYGLTALLKGEITLGEGRIQQSNFTDQDCLRMSEMPVIEVHIVKSAEPPTGIGEPPLPPLAPAVLNAVFAATGKRIRRLPVRPEDLKPA